MSKFGLLWEAHHKHISKGLSSLQQNGELVDMTLAADGHMVKVHQVIIALASPYFKELINSASCPHPVIFLNNISHRTLCSLLEYIYTGEVVVSVSNLNDLIVACKNLHIRGLEDMAIEDAKSTESNTIDNETLSFEENTPEVLDITQNEPMHDEMDTYEPSPEALTDVFEELPELDSETMCSESNSYQNDSKLEETKTKGCGALQFTISNQGSLQIILNRYLYYLKHSNKISKLQQWRCVNYVTSRCPAYIVTNGEVVVKRVLAHTHTYHDKRILKKYERNLVFHAYSEAEEKIIEEKRKKLDPLTSDTNVED